VEGIDFDSDRRQTDLDVIRIAWRDPDNLVPVEPGSFVTWFDDRDSVRVAFSHKYTGERLEGDTYDVFGLVWLEDGEVRISSLGQVPLDWTR